MRRSPSLTSRALPSSLLSAGLSASLLLGALGAAGCGEVEESNQPFDCSSVAGLIACNTFEAAPSGGWTKLEMNGTAVIDAGEAYTGKSSLSTTVNAMGGKAVFTTGIAAADRYYAKLYAFVPADSDKTGAAFMHLGETSGMYLGTNVEISGGMIGTAIQSASVYEYPAAMPVDRWVCLELDLTISDAAGRVLIRADGTTVVDKTNVDTKPAGAIGDLEVGNSYAGGANTRVLIDDVVVAREPLPPCD